MPAKKAKMSKSDMSARMAKLRSMRGKGKPKKGKGAKIDALKKAAKSTQRGVLATEAGLKSFSKAIGVKPTDLFNEGDLSSVFQKTGLPKPVSNVLGKVAFATIKSRGLGIERGPGKQSKRMRMKGSGIERGPGKQSMRMKGSGPHIPGRQSATMPREGIATRRGSSGGRQMNKQKGKGLAEGDHFMGQQNPRTFMYNVNSPPDAASFAVVRF